MYSENLSISEVKANLFEKRTVVELEEKAMTEIDGGTTPACVHIIAWGCLLYVQYKEGHQN